MIYGRRLFDKSLEDPYRRKPALRVFKVVNSRYQWKYTWQFNFIVLGAFLIFAGPMYYFFQQNHEVFVKIAIDTHPALLEHLDRESYWILGFFAFSLVSLIILTTWMTLRMTTNILGPLVSLERHMWKVTSGDWSSEDFRIRVDDDFRELADTYSYLYRALRAQAQMEVELLERIAVDPEQRDSFNALQTLLELKRSQMAGKKPLNGAPALPLSAGGQRRAS